MEMFEVGGCVRDEILGLNSKDIDFTVVLPPGSYRDPFRFMAEELEKQGFEIFLETPEFLTIRARFPKKELKMNGDEALNRFQFANPGLTADFVLARKESGYSDGRRPDEVRPGTLEDDLARRDFTMNAIARNSDGFLIDPFNGREDIRLRIIRAVGNPYDRIVREDALRGLRALRFAVTKKFRIDPMVSAVIDTAEFRTALRSVSTERQREELDKMFKVNTIVSLRLIQKHGLEETLFFGTGLRLMPTLKG